ncbi:MAG: SdpI family protein [Victivallales bacterium]|nr:SdpI family protein [Victivallales bacterium]
MVGNLLPKLRPNKYVDIRLPWIMHDEARWAKTHRFGGFAMVLCGVAMLVCSLFASVPSYCALAMLLVTVGVIVAYSWVAKG